MCILLKLNYPKFGVSNLFFSKVIEEKLLGGQLEPPRVKLRSAIVLYLELKVIDIRPMAPVLNTGHLKVSEQEMLSFSVRKEIVKKDNSLVVILLSKVVENEFLQTL